MIYKTLLREQTIEQYESNLKSGMNAGAPEWLAVPAPHVTSIVLLSTDTIII
jgi:hypothetical protein